MANRLVFAALGIATLSAAGFVPSVTRAQEEPAAAVAAPSLPAIVVTDAKTRAMVDRVLATGTVEAVEEVFVSPLVEGLSIRALNADIGDRVEADGTLAVLNDDMLLLQKSQYLATVAKAEASLAQSEAQLAEAKANADEAVRVSDRSQTLAKNGTVSTAAADQARAASVAALARVNSAEQLIAVARADIAVAQSQIADIDLRLARTAVKAPVGGIVAARSAKIGAIASGAGTPLFTIIRDGALEVKADVTEADLVRVVVGQKVHVTLAGGAATVEGVVRLIAPTVDAQTRLGTVHITLTDPARARVGMYASTEIIVEEKQAIALPLTAVTTTGGKSEVRRVENGIVTLVGVETGIQDGQQIEIRSGLKDGDQVVAKAGAYVRDGDKINPVASMPAATN